MEEIDINVGWFTKNNDLLFCLVELFEIIRIAKFISLWTEIVKVSILSFFFKQKTAYEIRLSLVGSEMCIRDSWNTWEKEQRRKVVNRNKWSNTVYLLHFFVLAFCGYIASKNLSLYTVSSTRTILRKWNKLT